MNVFNLSDYFKIHILKNITFQHYSLVIQDHHLKCSYQKITQEKLNSANRKFAYHITNIFSKTTKILIHFILSSTLICIQKAKLLGYVLTTSDVLNKVNLDKILKFDLGYKELGCIWTLPNYLDQLQKYVFAMIRQLKPPKFFVTFTIGINNWPTLIKILKQLYEKILTKRK
jgi:hypothetical protein